MKNFSYSAKVLPLKGKYYGTIVELTDESGRKSEIKVWIDDPDCELSARELKDYGYKTREEAFDDGYPCDCHYESNRSLWLANRIADAINAQPY
jgi:hypothetical protein